MRAGMATASALAAAAAGTADQGEGTQSIARVRLVPLKCASGEVECKPLIAEEKELDLQVDSGFLTTPESGDKLEFLTGKALRWCPPRPRPAFPCASYAPGEPPFNDLPLLCSILCCGGCITWLSVEGTWGGVLPSGTLQVQTWNEAASERGEVPAGDEGDNIGFACAGLTSSGKVPGGSVPTALVVRRGKCSFGDKALHAQVECRDGRTTASRTLPGDHKMPCCCDVFLGDDIAGHWSRRSDHCRQSSECTAAHWSNNDPGVCAVWLWVVVDVSSSWWYSV